MKVFFKLADGIFHVESDHAEQLEAAMKIRLPEAVRIESPLIEVPEAQITQRQLDLIGEAVK